MKTQLKKQLLAAQTLKEFKVLFKGFYDFIPKEVDLHLNELVLKDHPCKNPKVGSRVWYMQEEHINGLILVVTKIGTSVWGKCPESGEIIKNIQNRITRL